MGKTWLVEGFCPVDHYHCLMPVEYEAVEENGVVQEYKKSKMVCGHSLSRRNVNKKKIVRFLMMHRKFRKECKLVMSHKKK